MRVSVPKALCFFNSLSTHAKMAKYAPLTSARAEVPDRVAHVEGTDTTLHLKHALFARVSRCVRSYR